MLETEYKCIIDEGTYKTIENAYHWDWVKEQTNNYYFDESLELSRRRIMVRIREKDGIYKVQVKLHKNSDSPLHICEENEFDTDSAPQVIDAVQAKKFTGIDTGRLLKSGTLKTLRHSLMWNDTTEICLDKNTYLDRTDYEIEVEYTNGMPKELVYDLKSLGVDFTENAVGKYTRFMKRLKELMDELKN